MLLLQADTTDLIEKGLTINPYGLTVYGALVVALSVACVFFWRKILQDDKEYKKVLTSSTEILTAVKLRLDDQQTILGIIQELKLEIVTLKEFLSQK